MSRELLKRALESMRRTRSIPTGESIDTMSAIETYLAQPEPEPEPVAWMWTDGLEVYFENNGDPDHNWVPLYTTLPDQSARIAKLEKDNNIMHENLAWYMEKYHEHLTISAKEVYGIGVNHE